MKVKFSVIVMYVRLLTMTSSLLVELGFFKMNKEIGTLLPKKELNINGVWKNNIIMRISIYLLTATPTNYTYTF